MVDFNVLTSTIIYASVLSLLSLGIALIYMTTKVFNFAHPRLSLVGSYAAVTIMAYYASKASLEYNFEPKETILGQAIIPYPASFYILGVIAAIIAATVAGLAEYYLILRPLLRRGADYLKLMIATLAYDFILLAILFLYNTHLSVKKLMREALGVSSTKMDLSSYDLSFTMGDRVISGAFIYSLTITLLLTIILYLLLFKTKLGIKMRASIENPPLAEVLGIDVERVYAIAWIISGITAGIAGFIIVMSPSAGSLKPVSATSPADEIVVSAFAGSIVGGVTSIFGSLFGGALIGFIETLFTNWLQELTGFGKLFQYNKVFSMMAVAITLLFAPKGIAGLRESKALRRVFNKLRPRGGV
ncbi:MAG: branched-chain amino acid ABC transporter permease [Desulfurococcales archaeon]|nr:branched-chain amino acid ABC transporter permease [Desulfurococcales archaeon]